MATNFFGGYEPRTYAEDQEERRLAPGETGSGMDTWRYGSPTNVRNWQILQSQGSGGGGGSRSSGPRPTGSTQTSTVEFTGEAPEAPKIPKLELPKFDKRAVRALTQKLAAPSLRKLGEGLQSALTVQSDNPNVRRMTLREALQGYGTGLEQTMSGAGTQARQEHQQELAQEGQEAQMNWQAQTQALMQQYNNAFQKYMASATRTQTQQDTFGPEGSTTPGMSPRQQAFQTWQATQGPAPAYATM